MGHQQNNHAAHQAQGLPAPLTLDDPVLNADRAGVFKDECCRFKTNPVLCSIAPTLVFVSLEAHERLQVLYIQISSYNTLLSSRSEAGIGDQRRALNHRRAALAVARSNFISPFFKSASTSTVSPALFKIVSLEAGPLEQMPQQANLQGPVPVDGDGKSDYASGLSIDVVTAMHAEELPAISLGGAGKFLAGDRLHTAISSTLSLLVDFGGSTSTDKQPSMASWRFAINSSRVSL